MTSEIPAAGERFLSLDGLRGLAVIAVVFFHSYSRWLEHTPWLSHGLIAIGASFGWLGVQLFFLISGYVIFQSLDRSRSFLDFATRRWIRLFPAMFLASVIIIIFSFFFSFRPGGKIGLWDFIPGITFIHPSFYNNFLNLNLKSLDGAFWSLYVEVFFYFVSSFFYFAIKDRRAIGLGFLCFAYFFYSFFLDGFFEKIGSILGLQYYPWFCAGVYFYFFSSGLGRFYLIVSLGYFFLGCFVVFLSHGLVSSLVSLVFLSVFYLVFFFGYVRLFFSGRLIVGVGNFSYSWYLIHQNIIISFAFFVYLLFGGGLSVLYVPLGIAFSVLVGAIVYFGERYSRARLSSFVSRRVS